MKSQFFPYTPAINNWNLKLKKNTMFNSTKEKGNTKYKSNKTYIGPVYWKLQGHWFKKIKSLNKWRNNLCSWFEIFSIIKMSIAPNLIYRFNVLRILASYFENINYLILKFIWKGEGPRTIKTILKKENKTGQFTLSHFKTYN